MDDFPLAPGTGAGALAHRSLDAAPSAQDALFSLGGGSAFLLEQSGGFLCGSRGPGRLLARDGRARFHWMSRGQLFRWGAAAGEALDHVMAAFPPLEPTGPGFTGGALGLVSFEGNRPLQVENDLDLPEASFILLDRLLRVKDARAETLAYAAADDADEARVLAAEKAALLDESIGEAAAPPPALREPAGWTASLPEGAFRSALVHAREVVRQGEVEELRLSARFERPFRGDPRPLFERLPKGDARLFLRLPEATVLATLVEGAAAGFLSGRPEAAARELLAELEPVPRGYQGGELLLAGFDGSRQRFGVESSLQILGGRVLASTAVTVREDSDPVGAWEELRCKIEPWLRVVDAKKKEGPCGP